MWKKITIWFVMKNEATLQNLSDFDNKSLHKRFQSVIDQIKKFLNYKTSDLIEILNNKIHNDCF